MKRNLLALALLVFFGNVLFVSAQDTVPDDMLGPSTLRVSPYGTLLNVFNPDGTPRFGTPLNRDGFLVRYSLGGQMKTVQAIGETASEGLQSSDPIVVGNSTIVIVTTADNALRITCRFTFHKEGEDESIVIHRTLTDTSVGDLKVVATTQFLDPIVMGGRGARSSNTQALQRREANRLKREAEGVRTAGGRILVKGRVTAYGCENCLLEERPPHEPPCFTIVCWETSAGGPPAARPPAARPVAFRPIAPRPVAPGPAALEPSAYRPLLTTTVNEISVEWKPRTEPETAVGALAGAAMPSPVRESEENGEKHFMVAVRLKGR